MRALICRRFTFEAAHSLPDHPKCGTLHGHSYKLEVTLEGKVDENTGMVLDFGVLKEIVQRAVLQDVDHKILNGYLNQYRDLIDGKCAFTPTAEVLVNVFAERLKELLKPYTTLELHTVKLWETEDAHAEWTSYV